MSNYRLDINLPGLPETTNQVLAMGLRARMRRKAYWKDLVWKLTAGKRPAVPLARATLTLIRCSTTRPDPDGLVSSFKHIIDSLTLSRVLENDRHENIGFPNYGWAHAKMGAGHCLIIVEGEV